MKHLRYTFLVLFITLLCGVSLGMCLYKRSICQALADAMERHAWDIVCEDPLDNGEVQRVRKEKL
jgi:hypothetical protein